MPLNEIRSDLTQPDEDRSTLSRALGNRRSDNPELATRSDLDVRGIGRRDPKGQGWLIRDVSLSVTSGERLGILGPTGAGKSVLLRSMALLDPLDIGSIHWQGRAIAGDAGPAYRSQVIYLHQRPALLEGTVEDNLRYPFTLRTHVAKRFDRDRVAHLLEGLGRPTTFLGSSAAIFREAKPRSSRCSGRSSSTRPCSCWTSRPPRSIQPRPETSRG